MENRRLHQWSSLQAELLGLILKKLDLADHARFASVCSSWRSVAVENPPINKHLYLALSHEPENLVRRFITSFVVPSWKEARFIGALDGWVVILIDRKHLFLLNKGFNSIIPLPPLPDSDSDSDSDSMDYGSESMDYYLDESPESCKAALSSPPSSSSGECTVVLSHKEGGVFYCRLGSDKSFKKLSHFMDWIEDILFHKGRLYVLCFHCTHTIIIFDHLLNKVSELDTDSHFHPEPTRWLISGNDTLCGVNGEPHGYSVFTLEGNEPIMVEVNNIDEDDNFQILLSNQYCSLSLTTKEHKEFRRDYPKDDHGSISTFVIDTSKDPNKAKADDPWPLFFIMFSSKGIKNEESPIVVGSHKAFVDEKRTETRVTNGVVTNGTMASGGFQNDNFRDQGGHGGNTRSDFRGHGEYPVQGRGPSGHDDFYQPWAHQNLYGGNARSDFWGRGEYPVRGQGPLGPNDDFYQPWAHQNGYGGNARSNFRGCGDYPVQGRAPPGHDNDFYQPWANQNGYGGNARSDFRSRGEYPVRGRGAPGHDHFYQPWANQNEYGGNAWSDFRGRGECPVRGWGPAGHNDFYQPWANQNGYGGNAGSDFMGCGEYPVRGQGPPGHNDDFYQPWAHQNGYGGNARSDFMGCGEYPVRGQGPPGHNDDFYPPWAHQNGYPRASHTMGPSQLH